MVNFVADKDYFLDGDGNVVTEAGTEPVTVLARKGATVLADVAERYGIERPTDARSPESYLVEQEMANRATHTGQGVSISAEGRAVPVPGPATAQTEVQREAAERMVDHQGQPTGGKERAKSANKARGGPPSTRAASLSERTDGRTEPGAGEGSEDGDTSDPAKSDGDGDGDGDGDKTGNGNGNA